MVIKSSNNNYVINIESNKLTFLDNRFYATDAGDFVPSVTTLLESYPRSSQFYEWLKTVGKDADTIRDEAGNRGSTVHRLTERYDNGEEVCLFNERGEISYKLSEWNMFEKYVAFRRLCKPQILHNEITCVSAKHRIGGTIDRVMRLNNELFLVDLKTSNGLHPHYWLQLAAYRVLLEEKMDIIVDGIAVLWLNAKTKTEGRNGSIQGKGWQLVIERGSTRMQEYWRRFKACQQLWLAENANAKPVDISYSLCHITNNNSR
jgi:hypothetical protein